MTDAADTILGEMLEGDLAAVAVQVHTAVGRSIAVCGQGVIGAAGIVASTLTGILAQENATGVYHLISHLGIVLHLQDEVLWGVGIREVDGLLHAVHQYQSAVLQRLGCHLLAWQQVELAVHLGLNVENHLF